jgi:hypothetical protein
LDVLNAYSKDAELKDREVTLTLAVASAAILVPYERLRLHGDRRHPHPSADRYKKEYEATTKRFGELLDESFLGSRLWPGEPRTWQYGKIDSSELAKDPDDWLPSGLVLPSGLRCGKVLSTIRNALAHGNIWVQPTEPDRQIERVAFASVFPGANEAVFVAAAPLDFAQLLKHWIEFLALTKLPIGFA